MVLDGLHLLFQRSRLFRGQNSLPVPQVIVRHGEDGLVIGHVADDTGHIDKPSQFAGPLAAVSGDDLISAALTGTHQRRLIDSGSFNRLHQPLHFRIVPDAKGMIFERVQLGKIEIHDLLFHTAGGIPRGGRPLGCSRGLRRGGSAFPGRRLALGHFVPRLRLGLVGSRLVSLGWAAPAGLGRILRFIRLLALIRGNSFFRGLALRRPIPGSGKIHHLSSGGRITHTGDRGLLLVLARRCISFRRSRSVLVFGSLLLGLGGLILHRKSSFGRLYFSRLGGIVYISTVGNIPFIVSHLKTSFVVKWKKPA